MTTQLGFCATIPAEVRFNQFSAQAARNGRSHPAMCSFISTYPWMIIPGVLIETAGHDMTEAARRA